MSAKDVPDAETERPTDVLVRITGTNICGSDLHMYEARADFETGRRFGHKHLGEVIEVGGGVDKVRVGGPIGLMAALSATIRGVSRVMVVDRHPDRLRLAESIGAITIDDSNVEPVEGVLEETMGWSRTTAASAWATRRLTPFSRASTSAAARHRSRGTTDSCATSSPPARPSPRSSSTTSCHWTRHPRLPALRRPGRRLNQGRAQAGACRRLTKQVSPSKEW